MYSVVYCAVPLLAGGPDVFIMGHRDRRAATAPVVLTEGQSVSPASCSNVDPIIRSHGKCVDYTQMCTNRHK